jgi:hypothetical protein
MAAYYPRRVARFADLQKAYPGFETYDDFEEDRIESVAITKSRGKGAPKKKRTAAGKWERANRERKRGLLTAIQSPRSLARRRGRAWAEDETPCFAICPFRANARACKNTHRHTERKSRGEEHWGSYEARGVLWSSLGIHVWRRKKLALYKKYIFQPSHTRGAPGAYAASSGSPLDCRETAVYPSSQNRDLQHPFLGKRHITAKKEQGDLISR